MAYHCEMCGGCFEEGWTKEEALAEAKANFGSLPPEEMAQVCDDCYKKIDPANHPHKVEEAVARVKRKGTAGSAGEPAR